MYLKILTSIAGKDPFADESVGLYFFSFQVLVEIPDEEGFPSFTFTGYDKCFHDLARNSRSLAFQFLGKACCEDKFIQLPACCIHDLFFISFPEVENANKGGYCYYQPQ